MTSTQQLPSFRTFLQNAGQSPLSAQVSTSPIRSPGAFSVGITGRSLDIPTLSPRHLKRSTFVHQNSSPKSYRASTCGKAGNSENCGGKRFSKKKYLKERERCDIVRRVRLGEKQAHLAKEYGVSRAAVCYLLKHQSEILQRAEI